MYLILIILVVSALFSVLFLLPTITAGIRLPDDSSNFDIVVYTLYRVLIVSVSTLILWAISIYAYTFFFG
jgi:hypothetical protein